MDIRTVTPELAVSPQIRAEDLAELAEKGFTTIINVRPDGEAADQPASSQIAEAAKALGLAYHYIPITPGQMTGAEVAAFAEACQEATGPVFAFCRTGTRAVMLWAVSHRQKLPAQEIAAKAKAAGYDLPPAITGT
ncbi:MAG: TIGR01244 family phosphatase [Alphaproteobacteria bacterium]|nr:MAG: TIGR01244 family phosphatase [Alphaproteobacteria bacterium]